MKAARKSYTGLVAVPVAYVRDLIEASTDARILLDSGLDCEVIRKLDKRLDRIEDFEQTKLSDEARTAIDLFDDRAGSTRKNR